jgi:hypothetical protein
LIDTFDVADDYLAIDFQPVGIPIHQLHACEYKPKTSG